MEDEGTDNCKDTAEEGPGTARDNDLSDYNDHDDTSFQRNEESDSSWEEEVQILQQVRVDRDEEVQSRGSQ